MQQEGTLMCNRVGHNSNSIQTVCVKKGCEDPIPCCMQCMMQDHKNHKTKDFIEMRNLQKSMKQSLQFLDQLTQFIYQVNEVCQSWQKGVYKMINHVKENLILVENPTLTQLTKCVESMRDINIVSKQQELLDNYKNQVSQINNILQLLKSQTSILLNCQEMDDFFDNKIGKFTLTDQLSGHKGSVGIIAISNDDKHIASSEVLGRAKNAVAVLWDLKLKKKKNKYNSCCGMISALQFSNDNKILAIGSYDLLDVVIELFDIYQLKQKQPKIILQGHQSSISKIKFTDDSSHLISVSDDKSLRVWDMNKGNEINKQIFKAQVIDLTYSNKLQMIACCGLDGYAYLLSCTDFDNLNILKDWQVDSVRSNCIEFIKYSTIIMVNGSDGTKFWNTDDLLNNKLEPIKVIKENSLNVKVFPVNNPQLILLCSSDNKYINILNYHSNELIQSIKLPDELFYHSFAFTNNLKQIITGGYTQYLKIFEQITK